ncbi:radical SAM domain protein [Desulfosarcina variabilis str. Montpellier]|uniref:radical SAM protein n=1 Tax=Desulfosarcina variabilis TaxID=2300 RepID=UPI003AFA40A1
MFEQGAIRPPNEASSLLVRVTRNCPWNRCHICPPFKGKKFSRRPVEEVKRDIDMMAQAYKSYAHRFTAAFLQDADTLILPADELVEIMTYIKKIFPNVERITTYARAKSMKLKSQDDYRRLTKAGLRRIHSGMESGSAAVLKLINKGNQPEDILEGGRKVVASDISLSEYIMPGVGGKELSREHALETARLLNQIRPEYIRVRTFAAHPLSPMQKMIDNGTFAPMNDEEVVEEIRLLLENLDEMPTHFRCGDFSMNLLMQVDGRLDQKKAAMIEEIDRYLSLSREQKQAFSLIQRSYPRETPLDVVLNRDIVEKIRQEVQKLEDQEEGGFDRHIRTLLSYQLPQPQTDCWET